MLDPLAVAFAEAGQFDQAVARSRTPLPSSKSAHNSRGAALSLSAYQSRLDQFAQRRPYRELKAPFDFPVIYVNILRPGHVARRRLPRAPIRASIRLAL